MTPTRQGSFRLFRLAGIEVFLHWSWFIVALYEINDRQQRYSSLLWNVLEYLALFCLVLLHEFGHSLACRQVGGRADQIVLWPLGGVAYVAPPPRPGATLWSIAAGPLVNVVLLPVFIGLFQFSRSLGWPTAMPNAHALILHLLIINCALLVFNLMPVYPLDGGQILRSLLWFVLGRARSLMVATIVGFIGVAGLVAIAVFFQDMWIAIMTVFILLNCWGGLMQARRLARLAKLPHHTGFACPTCREPPPKGTFWVCHPCRVAFDTFETQGACPRCGALFPVTQCLECGATHPIGEWTVPPPLVPR